MVAQQNPKTLDEICKKGNLEEFRDTIKQIIYVINCNGCRVSTQYIRPTSSLDWSTPGSPMIRLNMQSNEEPLHIVWSLLHEYGHFLSEKPKASDEKIHREFLAWELADELINHFPQLCENKVSYSKYRAACLNTYELGLKIKNDES